MYYPDLSQYTYSEMTDECTAALNVGWLSANKPYGVGPVPIQFMELLKQALARPINLTRGSHGCEFCLADAGYSGESVDGKTLIQKLRQIGGLGNGEILIRGANGECFFAPTLVLHYIEVHGYRPPDEFIAGVLLLA